MAAPIDLYFVILPDTLVMDWAGPAEAFRIANQKLAALGQDAKFALKFVGPVEDATSSVGLMLTGLEALPSHISRQSWLILLGQPGECMHIDRPATRQVLRWLRALHPLSSNINLVSVCAGALLLAHSGHLKHKKATTHHTHLDELRQAEPLCEVLANRVFVMEDQVATSAGVSTGIDLAIALIAQHCGETVAAYVAQTMVVAQRRGANDPELSPFLKARNHLHPALHRVQDAVSERPLEPWTAESMAKVAHVTTRHLSRLFSLHTDTSPLHYLRDIRLALARKLLEQGLTVTRAAERSGFGSDLQLRRAWVGAGWPGTPLRTRRAYGLAQCKDHAL